MNSDVNSAIYHHFPGMDSSKTMIEFGILLPITSRGLLEPSDSMKNLSRFADSLQRTTHANIYGSCSCHDEENSKLTQFCKYSFRVRLFVGIDKCDTFLSHQSEQIKGAFLKHGIHKVKVIEMNYSPGSICAIWRDLAKRAHQKGCDFTVLLGDDVVLKTESWMSRIYRAFLELAASRGVPVGFGCVSFTDDFFPGFPTFPVIGKLHLDIFGGDILPEAFVNQDGDPYLFQLYRRWGCSRLLEDVRLENTVGGSRMPRYEEQHLNGWAFGTLDFGVSKVREWLEENVNSYPPPVELLTLDVIIPSYRVPLENLDSMIKLSRPDTCSTTIIIIVDNPLSPQVENLKHRYERDAFVRIRVNEKNLGASLSRNRGLAESAADYVLFLDDDVIPDANILWECESVIRRYPRACGFVGSCQFPDPGSAVFPTAILMSGVTFFWEIARHMSEDIPWGVTANLLVRRVDDDILFDARFPKTGGGEDIDYCLRKREFHVNNILGGEGFRAAPGVRICHPWWNDGRRTVRRFVGWGYGDSALIKMYPHFTYLDAAPSSAEMLLMCAILVPITAVAAIFLEPRALWFTILRFVLMSAAAVPLATMLYEVRRHVYMDRHTYGPQLQGLRRIQAAIESSFVRMASEWGRLLGIIERREWGFVGRRFDWFAGRLGEFPMRVERHHSLNRFLLWLGAVTTYMGLHVSSNI